MTSSVTHFEIYAEEPTKLVEFYRTLLGWQIDKAPGIDYWRIETGPAIQGSAEGCCPGRSRARAAGCTTSTSSRWTRLSSGSWSSVVQS